MESIKIEITKGAETNQTQGQSFLNYLKVTDLPVDKLNYNSFKNTNSNAVLIANDRECKQIAEELCNYTGTKGLDFVARINNKFIVGEAKFISDYGGNQDKSLLDAKTLLSKTNCERVIIIDGVCFMKSKHSLYKTITNELRDENVLSALLLNDFLKFKLNET